MHTLIDRPRPVSESDAAEALGQVWCVDAQWLRAEFDAIITAARPLPAAAPPRRRVTATVAGPCPGRRPLGAADTTGSRAWPNPARGPGSGEWPRQRSPPPHPGNRR